MGKGTGYVAVIVRIKILCYLILDYAFGYIYLWTSEKYFTKKFNKLFLQLS